jgi:hypothetical protein
MEINAIYEGDNLEVMNKFPSKSIDLIYADPPFFTNKQFEIIWHDGAEKRAFEDRWKGGIEHYISWMEPRLEACHRLLKNTGSFFIHFDYHASAHLRILLDRIFGESNSRMKLFGKEKLGEAKRNIKVSNLVFVWITFCFMRRQRGQNLTPNLYRFQKRIRVTKSMLKSFSNMLTKKVENTELLICLVPLHDQT